MAVVLLVGLLAPVLAPHDPHALSGSSLETPSGSHLLGTNDLGQDLLSQLLWGARGALVVAIVGAALATVFGGLAGTAAGLLGGMTDIVIMRSVDTFLAMPGLPLMVVIAALVGPSQWVVVLLIGLVGWPLVARIVRTQARSLRERDFVAAARGFGAGPIYVLRRHIVPAMAPVLVSRFLFWAPIAIFIESGLAFLGVSDPLGVSWGATLNKAVNSNGLYFTSVWVWWVLPSSFAIALTVLGFTLVGIGLEPWLNPRVGRRA